MKYLGLYALQTSKVFHIEPYSLDSMSKHYFCLSMLVVRLR